MSCAEDKPDQHKATFLITDKTELELKEMYRHEKVFVDLALKVIDHQKSKPQSSNHTPKPPKSLKQEDRIKRFRRKNMARVGASGNKKQRFGTHISKFYNPLQNVVTPPERAEPDLFVIATSESILTPFIEFIVRYILTCWGILMSPNKSTLAFDFRQFFNTGQSSDYVMVVSKDLLPAAATVTSCQSYLPKFIVSKYAHDAAERARYAYGHKLPKKTHPDDKTVRYTVKDKTPSPNSSLEKSGEIESEANMSNEADTSIKCDDPNYVPPNCNKDSI